MRIMGFMKNEYEIDADLFEIFVIRKIQQNLQTRTD